MKTRDNMREGMVAPNIAGTMVLDIIAVVASAWRLVGPETLEVVGH